MKEGAHVGETHASATPSPRMPQPCAQGGWKSRRERAGGGGGGELRAAGQRNILVVGARGCPAGKEARSVLNIPLKLGVIVSSHDSVEALDLPSRRKQEKQTYAESSGFSDARKRAAQERSLRENGRECGEPSSCPSRRPAGTCGRSREQESTPSPVVLLGWRERVRHAGRTGCQSTGCWKAGRHPERKPLSTESCPTHSRGRGCHEGSRKRGLPPAVPPWPPSQRDVHWALADSSPGPGRPNGQRKHGRRRQEGGGTLDPAGYTAC